MTINDKKIVERDESDISLLETLITYLRHWKLFLISIAVFMIAGYCYLRICTPVYRIETDILIKDNKPNTGGQNDLLKDMGLYSSGKIIDNEIQILRSNMILEKVIKSLKLEVEYINTEGIRDREMYGNLPFEVQLIKPPHEAAKKKLYVQILDNNFALVNDKKVPVNTPVETESGVITVKPTLNQAISQYRKKLLIKFIDIRTLLTAYKARLKIDAVTKQTSVLNITLDDAAPQRGVDFLNRLVEEYNIASIEDKNKVTSNTLYFIDQELKRIASQLGSVEKNVEEYKSNNRITDINSQSQLFLQSVKDNDAEISKVKIQLSVLNSLERTLQNNQNQSKLPSLIGLDNAALTSLTNQLVETQLRRQNFLQTMPETNPLVRSLDDQIYSLKQNIISAVQSLKRSLEITQEQLNVKNRTFEATIKDVPIKERGLLDVMRKQEIQNNLFTYLLQKREETAMSLASIVSDSRTIDLAHATSNPIAPVKSTIYTVFFLLGLILPIVYILVSTLLNFKVTRRSDIERITKVPIVAEISQSDNRESLLVSSHPRSMVAEQIRSLRTNLQFLLPNENEKVILFTSSISGEGKSFVSLNLGAGLAMTGKKTIILELDLRKPKLHSGLNVDNSIGLSNYLIGRADYDKIIKEIVEQPNYYIITSGPIPPNPAELLMSENIGKLINRLKQDFDYVILDAPPIGLVTDAQILGAYADLTLYIVRHNYTAKNHIQSINNIYLEDKFKNLNLILNSVDLQMGYGTSYGYGYGYGYGYNYGGDYFENSNSKSGLAGFFKRKKT